MTGFSCLQERHHLPHYYPMPRKALTRQYFLDKANLVHNHKYDYSGSDIKSSRDYIDIKCPVHGDFRQRAVGHLMGQGCRKCRNDSVGNRLRYTKDDFIQEARKVHGDCYNYDKFNYTTNKKKGIIHCPLHQLDFEQTPSCHMKAVAGCPQCSRTAFIQKKKNGREKTILMAQTVHGEGAFNYDAIPENVHSHDLVTITCNTCGNAFEQLMYSHTNNGNGCPVCKVSKDERMLGLFIEQELGMAIIRSDRQILEGHEIDLLIPEKNIGIEVNGNYWHAQLISKEDKFYHLAKTELARRKGITLMQFFGDEIYHKLEICKSIIRTKLGKALHRIHARKCTIRTVEIGPKNQFLMDNHIQGKDQSRIKLGLYHGDELVSLMTFGKPRYNQEAEWELIRFCNRIHTSVMGAGSKLFTTFVREYKPSSIISYADRRISVGNIYDVLGFKHTHDALPRYYYMDRKNYLERFHRSNFTKARIKARYPDVDITKDEWSLMQELNYDRIWDCGNHVYVWKP